MTDQDRRYDDTRDLAMEAKILINAHTEECTRFKLDLSKSLGAFRNDVVDIRKDISSMKWIVAAIVGGLTLLGRLVELIPEILKTLH